MTEPTAQSQPGQNRLPAFHLSLQLFQTTGEEAFHLAVTVKHLTTAGVVLELLEPPDGFFDDNLKGLQGFLLGNGDHDGLLVKVPTKILWTKKHEEDTAATVGLELLKPLPLSMRHALEDDLAGGAKDMRVLWDYWDEMQQDSGPEALEAAPTSVPVKPVAPTPVAPQASPTPAASPPAAAQSSGGWVYLVGFAAIVIGVAMQYPQSEQMAFSGLVVMFLGSIVVAGKSLSSMWQLSSSHSSESR